MAAAAIASSNASRAQEENEQRANMGAPTIILFQSEREALSVLSQAIRRVYPDYTVEKFDEDDGQILCNPEQATGFFSKGKTNYSTLEIYGHEVASKFIVSIDYGNFYDGLDYELWLIAYYINHQI